MSLIEYNVRRKMAGYLCNFHRKEPSLSTRGSRKRGRRIAAHAASSSLDEVYRRVVACASKEGNCATVKGPRGGGGSLRGREGGGSLGGRFGGRLRRGPLRLHNNGMRWDVHLARLNKRRNRRLRREQCYTEHFLIRVDNELNSPPYLSTACSEGRGSK